MRLQDLRPGMSIRISKTVQVERVISSSIHTTDGRYFPVSGWSWEMTTPLDWPPKPGDMWMSNGIMYAAISEETGIQLVPVSSGFIDRLTGHQFDAFLKTNPVLAYREGN